PRTTAPPSQDETIWQKIHRSRFVRIAHPPVMLGITVVSLTGVVGYRFYNQPQLSVGTESPYTIYAPEDGSFVDERTTEEKRKEVRAGTIPRLQRDNELTAQLKQQRSQYLDAINQLRYLAGTFPYIDTNIFTLEQQHLLRSLGPAEWQQLENYLNNGQPLPMASPQLAKLQQLFDQQKATTSPQTMAGLLTSIRAAQDRYSRVTARLAEVKADRQITNNQIGALKLDGPTWQTTQQTIIQVHDRILTQGLPAGITAPLLGETVQLHLRNILPPQAHQVAEGSLNNLLRDKYNLTVDKEATKNLAEKAVLAMETVKVSAEKNSVIVRAGEAITQEQFVLLDGYGLSQRQINWQGLLRTAGLVGGALIIFCGVSRRIHRPLRRRDHILLCLLSISTPVLFLLDPIYNNLPAISLLTSSFYGPTLAITQVVLVGGLSAFAMESIVWEYLLGSGAAALLAGMIASKLRSRDELALLGVGVGATQGIVYLFTYLIVNASAVTIIWYTALPSAIVYGLLGLAWSAMAIGVSPYLERLFDVVTPTRLVELSNPNCPLLQRLAKEAPGTFQHTLFVACLAESAARELRCNVELVRTGTLYHDIGKMHDPLGFIENQMGGPNKHDEINDPYVSVDIIKKHVSEGLVMARRYGLPQVVRDFIPEHQGQMLISYFYIQAKEAAEKAGEPPINEEEFRYPGPIPQSRETGIVMLADSCEAALRSLREANPETAMAMVNRIFKARWRDNQLQDSGLKYEELPIIADVFVRVWQQFHHQRIAYPKAALDVQVTSPSTTRF
ncbi:HD family phosphohydrolase, partial [Synechocystis salina]|uniref:HD family phosphohydrolase n=1 Tax=Synechocystis salina TaxID=945780 RepID=UPI001D13F90A